MKKLLFVLVTGAILTSCSSIKVVVDYDNTVDFTQYEDLEYFGWADNSDQILNRFDKERIEEAFGNEFKKRGLNIVEDGEGDIVVSLYIVTEQKSQTTAHTTSTGGGYGGGYGGYYNYGPGYSWGGGHSTTTYSEYDYVEGTLIVSVFDATKKELVWESVGKGTINEDPKKREEGIVKAAAEMMKQYPVQPQQ
jgi:hypothetical protein